MSRTRRRRITSRTARDFKDRTGLLTAIAAEGHALLAATPAEAGDLRDAGGRYVRFAREHPAHFQVMFRPELLREDDLELTTARGLSREQLRTAVTGGRPEARDAGSSKSSGARVHESR